MSISAQLTWFFERRVVNKQCEVLPADFIAGNPSIYIWREGNVQTLNLPDTRPNATESACLDSEPAVEMMSQGTPSAGLLALDSLAMIAAPITKAIGLDARHIGASKVPVPLMGMVAKRLLCFVGMQVAASYAILYSSSKFAVLAIIYFALLFGGAAYLQVSCASS